MSGRIVKLLSIALLALLNIYFLVTLGVNLYSSHRDAVEAENAVNHAFRAAGIAINCELPISFTPRSYAVTRDSRSESVFARGAIGAATASRDVAGGDIYESTSGTVRISQQSEFIIEYSVGESGDERTVAEEAAKKLGLSLGEVNVVREGGFAQVYATQIYRGMSVLSAPVTFEFENGKLMRASGCLFGRMDKLGDRKYYDLPTLFVAFLAVCTESGNNIAAINDAVPTFCRKYSGGTVELEFGYLVSTTAGDWYLNAEDGSIQKWS